MLDLRLLQRIRLSAAPRFQRLVAWLVLAPNYAWFPGVDIVLEGEENLPPEPVIWAMNHTDRYNYWPFQYRIWRKLGRFTAPWVKGKYYQHWFVGRAMAWSNTIPAVSLGYLIVRDFLSTMGRKPSDEEYRAVKNLVEAAEHGEAPGDGPSDGALSSRVPGPILQTPRQLLGIRFDPSLRPYGAAVAELYRSMLRRVVELNEDARRKNLDLIIFPQGTRSKRMTPAKPGIAQIALHLDMPIVPVGCNGSDRIYPGGSPIAKKGRVVYRIGPPIAGEELRAFHPGVDFEPFTARAEAEHGARFEALAARVTQGIDALLDEEYRLARGDAGDAAEGMGKFV